MRVSTLCGVLTLAISMAAWSTRASVVLNPTGAGLGSASVVYEGSVTYQPLGGGSATASGTIIEKTYGAVGAIAFAVQYSATDLDFTSVPSAGPGFRWTEIITNNTGIAWTDYHLELTGAGTFYADTTGYHAPGFVDANTSVTPPTINYNIAQAGTVTLSADHKQIDIVFNTPLAPGSTFDIHTPIVNLSVPASGQTATFDLIQAPSVPLPASLWGGLVLLGGLGTARKLRRTA